MFQLVYILDIVIFKKHHTSTNYITTENNCNNFKKLSIIKSMRKSAW